jgi:hypothetical protein
MHSSLHKTALTVIVSWEAGALRRAGGYNVRENNLFIPEDGSGAPPAKNETQANSEDPSYK